MSQHDVQGEPEHSDAPPRANADAGTHQPADVTTTGVRAVDEVVASVHDLDQVPLEEHVVVFEQAHERLRRALDAGRDG